MPKKVYSIAIDVYDNGDINMEGSADFKVLGITMTGTNKMNCNINDVANNILDYVEIMKTDDYEIGIPALFTKLSKGLLDQSTIERFINLDLLKDFDKEKEK